MECITRNELLEEHKVRSKTMKVIVKAKDHAKAMNPDIWPFRVGVRYFRAESRKPEGPGGSRNSSQGAVTGILTSRTIQEAGAGGSSNQENRVQPSGAQQSRSIPGSSQWEKQRNQREIQNPEITMRNI